MENTKQHLVLIGLMGCGKSSVGRELSALTGMPYLDTDRLVEAQMRKSITEIFAQFGEARFREMEYEKIGLAMSESEPVIVSTGGGAVVSAANRELLWQHGWVVYLQADAELLYERTARDSSRPLLQTADPRGRITELLQERAPWYAQADCTVSIHSKSPPQIAAEILRHWRAR